MLNQTIAQSNVISFFDMKAHCWDRSVPPSATKLERIFDLARITKYTTVLDVACGTGVLFPVYLNRDVTSVTAVDISSHMLEQARKKLTDKRISLVHADIESIEFTMQFDRIMIFNAIPHFPDPQRLLSKLSKALAPAGMLTIAHDIGRERLNALHRTRAHAVSIDLLPIEQFSSLCIACGLVVETAVSNDSLYVLSAYRPD